ncbi:MAG TPA: sigma-70 family RNA polymerase sigma factor [Puia sp.]|nr:sigma-70 family RNA polymerase sigma factor [Puia sp.]
MISDGELLHSIKTDDNAAAFETLFSRYWNGLYTKACQRVDKEVAKDLVQEVMTTLWRRRKEIFTFEDGEIGRYLFTAVKYRVISHYAYTAAEIKNSAVFEMLSDHTPPNSMETKELSGLIESEIKQLPARMQQVFRMSREEDLSIADIASRLNISEQTVKNQLTEALKRLRASIKSHDSGDWAFIVFLLVYYGSN